MRPRQTKLTLEKLRQMDRRRGGLRLKVHLDPFKASILKTSAVSEVLLESLSSPEATMTAKASARENKWSLNGNGLVLLPPVSIQTLHRGKGLAAL